MGAQEWAGLILTVTALTGSYLAGMRFWWAWYVSLGAIAFWLGYAIVTETWKYLPVVACYLFVYGSNAWRWTRIHRRKHIDRVNLPEEPLP